MDDFLSISLPANFTTLQLEKYRLAPLGSPSFPSPLDRLRSHYDAVAQKCSEIPPVPATGRGQHELSFAPSLLRAPSQNLLHCSFGADQLGLSLSESWALSNYLLKEGESTHVNSVRNPNKSICTIDRRSSEILTANETCARLIGFTPKEIIGKKLNAYLKLKDAPAPGLKVKETDLDDYGKVIELSGKLLNCVDVHGNAKPVSVWCRKVSSLEEDAGRSVVVMEPVDAAQFCLQVDCETGCVIECDDKLMALLQPPLIGSKLTDILSGARWPVKDNTKFFTVVSGLSCVGFIELDDKSCSATVRLVFYHNVSGMMSLLPSGRIQTIHPVLCKLLLGYRETDLLHRPVTDIIPDFFHTVLSDTGELLKEAATCSTPSRGTASQPSMQSLRDGCYQGKALHRSGGSVALLYQLRRVTLASGEDMWAVWLTRDTNLVPNEVMTSSEEEEEVSEAPETTAPNFESRYAVAMHMGRGAYGFVKSAQRRSDGLEVVVKFIKKVKLSEQSLVEHDGRLMPREAAILSDLRNPHIVPIIEVCESLRYFELVMPKHGAGMDLFEFIDREPHMDEPLGSFIFRQMVSAIEYLHSRNIAHRDIKDENIIIDEQFSVMLIDFGAAAFINKKQPFSVFCGTMEYCAPEILRGHKYRGPEADVWSLGVTLYTLMFSENPFYDMEETLAGILKPLVMPSPCLSRLLRIMLDINPDTRASITKVAAHSWTQQPVDMSNYKFNEVVARHEFCGNVGSDFRHYSGSPSSSFQISPLKTPAPAPGLVGTEAMTPCSETELESLQQEMSRCLQLQETA